MLPFCGHQTLWSELVAGIWQIKLLWKLCHSLDRYIIAFGIVETRHCHRRGRSVIKIKGGFYFLALIVAQIYIYIYIWYAYKSFTNLHFYLPMQIECTSYMVLHKFSLLSHHCSWQELEGIWTYSTYRKFTKSPKLTFSKNCNLTITSSGSWEKCENPMEYVRSLCNSITWKELK